LNTPSPQPDYTVRLVAPHDVPVVLALVRDVLAEYGFRFGIGAETDADLADLPGSYLDRGGAFWVLVDGPGTIVGTCGLFPVGEGVFELRKMYLVPAIRRRGLGQRLLDEALGWARRAGGRQIVLDTAEQMKRAIEFYERNGFLRDDEQIRGARCTRGYSRSL
jgi:putative acetyltransferase